MVSGLGVMLAGTVIPVMTTGTTWLIIARSLTGIGAAMVFPGTLSTLTNVVPPEKRGRAVGVWSAGASMGGMFGVLSGGALIEAFESYHSIFWGTAAITALALIAMLVFVPETKDPAHANLDPLGSVLSLFGVGGVILGITEGPVKGWSHPLTVVEQLLDVCRCPCCLRSWHGAGRSTRNRSHHRIAPT